tara:strand:+ start:300 stop:596 length:297 start_codon:yes stop_codon:yes gene_type:complete
MEQIKPIIHIEYCIGCRWLTRSSWMAQELLVTFEREIGGVTLVPSEQAGTFKVLCNDRIIWDRSTMGGFPELKVLKQLIRDECIHGKDLGHSDYTKNK